MPPGAVNPQPGINPPIGGAAAGAPVPPADPNAAVPVGGAMPGDSFSPADPLNPKALANDPATSGFMATLQSIRDRYIAAIDSDNYQFKHILAGTCNALANSVVSAIMSALSNPSLAKDSPARDLLNKILSIATDIVSQTKIYAEQEGTNIKEAKEFMAKILQSAKGASG